jgi:hypothetical protein
VVVAGLALAALVFSVLTYEDDPAQDRNAPIDVTALSLAVVGCGAAFVGAGLLEVSHSVRLTALIPLVTGTTLLVALVVHQFAKRNPLMPVRQAVTSVALAGLCIALTASAAAVGIMELVLQALVKSASPSVVALDFLPEFGGAIVVAAIFGALFRTRFTPLLALGGMPAIVASAAVFIARPPLDRPAVALGAGLLGLGVAASVSPALFMMGFSLRSSMLQRLFALIELLRGVTGFLVAPVLLFVATVVAATPVRGTTMALWVCLGVAVAGFVGGAALYGTGKGRLEAPDLERWQEKDEEAWSSPPLSGARAQA